MYLAGLVVYPIATLLLTFLILVPLSIAGFDGGDVPGRIGVPILVLMAVILPGLFGNGLYYRRTRNRIARSLTIVEPLQTHQQWLAARGGTSRLAGGAAVAAFAILGALIAAHEQAPTSPEEAARAPAAGPPNADRVQALLDGARRDFEAMRFTLPPDENAMEKLRQVLALEPHNQAATRASGLVVDRLAELTRESAEHGDFDQASDYLAQAFSVSPHSAALKRLERELAAHIHAVQARQAADAGDYESALVHVGKGLEAAPHASELQALRRELEVSRQAVLGREAASRGDVEQAEAHFNRARELASGQCGARRRAQIAVAGNVPVGRSASDRSRGFSHRRAVSQPSI